MVVFSRLARARSTSHRLSSRDSCVRLTMYIVHRCGAAAGCGQLRRRTEDYAVGMIGEAIPGQRFPVKLVAGFLILRSEHSSALPLTAQHARRLSRTQRSSSGNGCRERVNSVVSCPSHKVGPCSPEPVRRAGLLRMSADGESQDTPLRRASTLPSNREAWSELRGQFDFDLPQH